MKKVTVSVDLEFDDTQHDILWNLLGCDEKTGLDKKLAPYVRAAAHEYAAMFTGVAPITTATDIRERRLVAIIMHGLGKVPDAALVGRLFKIPVNTASTLIRNVSAKHDVAISPAMNATLYAIANDAVQDKKDKRFYVTVRDRGLVKQLNDILADTPQGQAAVISVKDTANRYSMTLGARNFLLKALEPAKAEADGG